MVKHFLDSANSLTRALKALYFKGELINSLTASVLNKCPVFRSNTLLFMLRVSFKTP